MKHTPCWTLLLAAALLGGCGKHGTAADQQAATNSASAEQAGSDSVAQVPTRGPGQIATPAPVLIADTGDTTATLNRLSLELRKYVLRTRSAPKSFDEFLAKSQVQAPPAPAGKQYAIQSGAVVLVKR